MLWTKFDYAHKCKYDGELPFATVTVIRDDGVRIPTVELKNIGKTIIPGSTMTESYFCSRCQDLVGDTITWGAGDMKMYQANSNRPEGKSKDEYEGARNQAFSVYHDGQVKSVEVPLKEIWTPCVHNRSCIGVCTSCLNYALRKRLQEL